MRAYGYIRVSRLAEDAVSPAVQRDEILSFATARGWTITGWYEDLNVSGRAYARHKRQGLDALLADALAGGCDTVVFYRIDRLAREESDFHAILATLQRAGVHCDSVGNPNDGTPESALIWSISAALAKYESVRLGTRLRDAHRRLAREGRWSGGPLPLGFQAIDGPSGTRLVAEPEGQRIRLLVHERYQAGWGAGRIARELNQQGIPSARGGIWERATVEALLFRPTQVGARMVEGELVFGGNIDPIVPLDVYERTLAVREARRRRPQVGRTPRVALTGRHVRCATCGGRLYARYQGRNAALHYYCQNTVRGLCDRGPTIRAAELASIVEARLFSRLSRARAPKTPLVPVPLAPFSEAVAQAEATLGRLATMYASGELLEPEYRSARGLGLKRLQKAEARMAEAVSRTERFVQEDAIAAVWSDLATMTPAQWHALSVQAQRDIYDLVLDQAVVFPKDHPRRRSEPHRVEVHWR